MELDLVSIVLFMLSSMLLAISSSLDLNTIRKYGDDVERITRHVRQGCALCVYHRAFDELEEK
jgi:hypothetical protein